VTVTPEEQFRQADPTMDKTGRSCVAFRISQQGLVYHVSVGIDSLDLQRGKRVVDMDIADRVPVPVLDNDVWDPANVHDTCAFVCLSLTVLKWP
jgi:hypothetical protein